jgi:hypothetical protein
MKKRRPKLVPLAKAIKNLRGLQGKIETGLENLERRVSEAQRRFDGESVPECRLRGIKVELFEGKHCWDDLEGLLSDAFRQAAAISDALDPDGDGVAPGAHDAEMFSEFADVFSDIQMELGY